MSIKENLEYLNFYIKNLSVDLVKCIEQPERWGAKVNVCLGFAEPSIIKENDKSIAVFPYKLDFKSSKVNVTSEFFICFALRQDSILTVEQLKSSVNNDKDRFTKYIIDAANKIVSNALEHTELIFENSISIASIEYK